MEVDQIAVFVGIDVGKSEHWVHALDRAGKKLLDKPLPNDETKLRSLYQDLARHGTVLVVMDQPATIGALAVAVAQDMEITVAYLPGLSMRRIADLSPGNAKTDAKDVAVIADAARTMPHPPPPAAKSIFGPSPTTKPTGSQNYNSRLILTATPKDSRNA